MIDEIQTRREFEKWYAKQPTKYRKRLERDILGDYFSPTTDIVWQAWKEQEHRKKAV
ncbi:hypothetical protein [Bergeriella denitrificans]|uniref:Uncharacterized protein n=1 Tax=Bergeriella denitrificans TaxID=494 RepID=A0A378UJ64_BERDE|nr:hypothetical protein [Bergeriella denitrificans]STZ77377.1 Uncharacterised protein [Bergeriella denitrificans]